jgi:hypothetical protein
LMFLLHISNKRADKIWKIWSLVETICNRD